MQENTNKLTQISELGEFGLINKLTDNIKLKHTSSIKGVGDDAAVLKYGDRAVVVTTDVLVEGIHFNLVYTPLKHLGYKAVTVNLSDVYAMNASPKQITVSIAISSKFSVEHIEEIYEGIKLACEKYNVDLVGGDTSSSLTGLMISVTAIGDTKENKIAYRNTAKKNDIVFVTGDLGGAYMGLQLLEREKKVFESNAGGQPELSGYDYILSRQLKPEPRQDIIELLNHHNIIPTSMIDISDGLSSELIHICNQSKVGCKLFQEKIPIDEETSRMAEEFGLEPTIAALNGGEDYELLFTVDVNDYAKIKDEPKLYPIGHITEDNLGRVMITPEGNAIELKAQGWKHE